MGVGGVFLLFVAAVVLIAIAFAFWALRAGLWAREVSDDDGAVESGGSVEPDATDGRFGRRPEHTEVDEPGKQRYVGR